MTRHAPAVLIVFLAFLTLNIRAQLVTLCGTLTESLSGKKIVGASIRLSNSLISTTTDEKGEFKLQLMRRPVYELIARHLSYENKSITVRNKNVDTIFVTLSLNQKNNLLDSVEIFAIHKPETIIGKNNYSIYDFDFYEDKYLLLTAEKNLKKASIRLADQNGHILLTWPVPAAAGEAQKLYRDYEGYTELICKDSIFRIEVFNQDFLISTVSRKNFSAYIEPVADTIANSYYWKKGSELYPFLEYFSLKKNDSISKLLKQISNSDLLKLYNLEYDYLSTRARLEVDRMAKAYNTDKHIIAAFISGFTSSFYYEPLYAPLFVLNDTIYIFNHHNDQLYHYNKYSQLIDSVSIRYHHPKKWKEWKRKLYVDEIENKVFAHFSRDGHHYLKQIDVRTGNEIKTYQLQNYSAGNIRVKHGFVYYVYRPYESTQQKFLYRERIN